MKQSYTLLFLTSLLFAQSFVYPMTYAYPIQSQDEVIYAIEVEPVPLPQIIIRDDTHNNQNRLLSCQEMIERTSIIYSRDPIRASWNHCGYITSDYEQADPQIQNCHDFIQCGMLLPVTIPVTVCVAAATGTVVLLEGLFGNLGDDSN